MRNQILEASAEVGSQSLPVIVVSGDAREYEARAAGAAAFFRKPFDFEKAAAAALIISARCGR
jgi:CheY-like chemotaxis protein